VLELNKGPRGSTGIPNIYSLLTNTIKLKMATELDAAYIARLSLHDPHNFSIQHAQTLHRIRLLQQWNIPTGSRVLELGCGQGDCTTVLACAVGEQGSVVAVDPADLGYGRSFRTVFVSCFPGRRMEAVSL